MVFVFHVTLQDHVIKAVCGLMTKSHLSYVTILPSLVAIGIMVVELK